MTFPQVPLDPVAQWGNIGDPALSINPEAIPGGNHSTERARFADHRRPAVGYVHAGVTASTTNPTLGPERTAGPVREHRQVGGNRELIASGTSGTNAGSGCIRFRCRSALGQTGSNLIGSGLVHAPAYTPQHDILVAGTGLTTFSMRYINQAVGGTLCSCSNTPVLGQPATTCAPY